MQVSVIFLLLLYFLYMRDIVFFSLIGGFLAGVFMRSFLVLGNGVVFLCCAVALATALILLARKTFLSPLLALPLVFLACAFGIFRFTLSDIAPPTFLESEAEQKVSLTGIVTEDPDRRDTTAKLVVTVRENTEEGIVLVSTDPYTPVVYGDEIRVTGKIKKPENFMTDQDKEFDYVHYLGKDDIFYTMSYAQVEVVSHGHGSFIRAKLFALKNALLKKFSQVVPFPESALLGGIVLGTKSALTTTLRDEFITTGTIHIVALSGYNVSIVAEAIMRGFQFIFAQTISIVFGFISIVLFVVMTGASSTAVRAGVMATLALFSRLSGRPYAITRALLVAATLMVLWNPKILVFDVSFQLSFLATLGLIFVAPVIERARFIKILPNFFKEIVSATISAQIAVLPFLLHTMGLLSIVSLPINLLILPFVPAAMFFGTAAGIIAFLSHLAALPFGFIAYGMLRYIFVVVHFGSTLPLAAVTVKNFPFVFMLLSYVGIGWWIWKKYPREQAEKETT